MLEHLCWNDLQRFLPMHSATVPIPHHHSTIDTATTALATRQQLQEAVESVQRPKTKAYVSRVHVVGAGAMALIDV
jgi:NADH dehydrogenase FAD-containing subunit